MATRASLLITCVALAVAIAGCTSLRSTPPQLITDSVEQSVRAASNPTTTTLEEGPYSTREKLAIGVFGTTQTVTIESVSVGEPRSRELVGQGPGRMELYVVDSKVRARRQDGQVATLTIDAIVYVTNGIILSGDLAVDDQAPGFWRDAGSIDATPGPS